MRMVLKWNTQSSKIWTKSKLSNININDLIDYTNISIFINSRETKKIIMPNSNKNSRSDILIERCRTNLTKWKIN